jgi:hypothetical protein
MTCPKHDKAPSVAGTRRARCTGRPLGGSVTVFSSISGVVRSCRLGRRSCRRDVDVEVRAICRITAAALHLSSRVFRGSGTVAGHVDRRAMQSAETAMHLRAWPYEISGPDASSRNRQQRRQFPVPHIPNRRSPRRSHRCGRGRSSAATLRPTPGLAVPDGTRRCCRWLLQRYRARPVREQAPTR